MQRICHFLILCLATATFASFAQDSVAPLATDFRVDESGAATFSIPLTLPTARGDLKPQLGLSYSSHNSRDGELGVGWNLQGPSALTRCRQSPIFDGDVGTITLTQSDRFCLDGQRLHLVTGTYGSPGSIYRINGQPGTVISAHGGNSSDGPAYFKRVTKAKETTYFGNAIAATGLSSDTQATVIPGANGVVNTWLMSSVEDVMSNYIQYVYETDNTVGESYLSEVRYGGHHIKAELPYIRVVFDRVTKAHPLNGFVAGYAVTQSTQIEKIRVLLDDEELRAYHFTYSEPLYANDKLMLVAINECNIDEHGVDLCTPTVDFDWHTVLPANSNFFNPYVSSPLNIPADNNAPFTKVFDITGDGLDDIILISDDAWRYRAGPTYAVETLITTSNSTTPHQVLVIDANGDGTRELLVKSQSNGNWRAVGANGTSFFIGQPAIGANGGARVMDVDGDAAEDIVFMENNKLFAYLNQWPGGFSPAIELFAFSSINTDSTLYDPTQTNRGEIQQSSALDVNGDGRSDMVVPTTESVTQCMVNGRPSPGVISHIECNDVGGQWETFESATLDVFLSERTANGPRLVRTQSWPMPNKGMRIADFNGDGLSDIAYVIFGRWHYRLSNGLNFGSQIDTGLDASDDERNFETIFTDVDADGRTDILHANSQSNWQVYLAQANRQTGGVDFVFRSSWARQEADAITAGFLSADLRGDLLVAQNGVWHQYAHYAGQITHVIDGYTTSFGVQTQIDYAPMSDDSVYVPSNPLVTSEADVVAIKGHMPLVARVSTATSALDEVRVNYRYGGQAVHKQGLGSLGFAWLETQDEQSGVITRTDYFQSIDATDYVLNGMPTSTEQTLNGQLLSRATNQLATRSTADGGDMGYIATATEEGYQYTSAGQSVLRTTTQTTTLYDDYGNVTELSVHELDESTGVSKTTQTMSIYGDQRFGRLTHTTVTRARSDDATVFSRESSFAYRNDGLLVESVVAPNDADYKLTTQYVYDDYGQKITTHVSGVAQLGGTPQTRSSYVVYDSRGRYVNYKENHWGYRTTYQYNDMPASSATGRTFKITETNTNGESAHQWFDAFGRVIQVQGADGVVSTTSRQWCIECEPSALFVEHTQTQGQPSTKTYADKWGRTVAKAQQGFDGTWATVAMTYDEQGRPIAETLPNSTLATYTSYDVLGRVTQIENPQGNTSTVHLGSYYTRSTNAKGQHSYEYTNGFGETTRTVDNLGGEVAFRYDANGNLIETTVTASGGQLDSTLILYDNWGHKIAMDDPVKGVWSYTYNAFGELIEQTSAHGQAQAIMYDSLGRKIRSYQPSVGTRCWYYGNSSAAHNRGRIVRSALHRDVSVDCDTTRTPEHQQQFSYDSAGRVSQQLTVIEGTAYVESYSYDTNGRLATTTYPSGTAPVSVRREYNSYGYFTALVRVETNSVLKTIEATNDQGLVTSISYQGGQQATRTYNSLGWLTYTSMRNSSNDLNAVTLTHDALGNVTSRLSEFERAMGASTLVDESFNYDGLNRLRSTDQSITDVNGTLTTTQNTTKEQRYDGFGNMTFRTGVGNYTYATDGTMRLTNVAPASGKDAPIIIDPPPECCEPQPMSAPTLSTTSTEPSSFRSFTYDASGNVLSDGDRTFTYDGADRVTHISGYGSSSSMRYDAQGALYYQQDVLQESNQSVTYTKHMVGGFEKKSRSGGAGSLTEYRYTVADDVVIVQRESASTSTEATYLLFKDHLGSVFTTLATTGEIISQQLFSAFGQTRTIYTAGGVALGSMLPPTEQGFTGHRQMDALGIVHMKGRIYDPTLGRFLQADPFVQAPKNSQNYNRYSYVLNNPMSYTDPSGYFFKSLFKGIKKYWRVIAAAVVSYFTFGAASGWASSWALSSGLSASAAGFTGAVVGGAAAGFVSGAIMTGSLRGAMSGALAGAITGGIFEGIAQYGFNTSTVTEAAGAMLLEEAGVPRETIMKLYSNGRKPQLSADGGLTGQLKDENLLGIAPEDPQLEFRKGFEKFKETTQFNSKNTTYFKDKYALGWRDSSGKYIYYEEFDTFAQANKSAALNVNGIDKVWLRGLHDQSTRVSVLYRPSTYSYKYMGYSLNSIESVMRVLSHETTHYVLKTNTHSFQFGFNEKRAIECARGIGKC